MKAAKQTPATATPDLSDEMGELELSIAKTMAVIDLMSARLCELQQNCGIQKGETLAAGVSQLASETSSALKQQYLRLHAAYAAQFPARKSAQRN